MSATAQIDMAHDRNMAWQSGLRRRRRNLTVLRIPSSLAALILLVFGAGLARVALATHGPGTTTVSAYRAGDRSPNIGDGVVPASILLEPNDGDRQLIRLIDHTQRTLLAECY